MHAQWYLDIKGEFGMNSVMSSQMHARGDHLTSFFGGDLMIGYFKV